MSMWNISLIWLACSPLCGLIFIVFFRFAPARRRLSARPVSSARSNLAQSEIAPSAPLGHGQPSLAGPA
jgi:hypothetical protein